ncbi:MAG: endonuclease III domain-containing protein [Blastocatellia bacterium]
MPKAQPLFQRIIALLEKQYGRPRPPRVTDPMEMILLENVAYLTSDEQRDAAFDALRKQIGLQPANILSASDEELLAVARLGGMLPRQRIEKLRRIAQITLAEFNGDLRPALALPLAKAKKALKKFPGIGDPGAEKILLFSRTQPLLALESNGLRVLIRLGFGEELKNYSATYRAVQEAMKEQLKDDCDWLIGAHLLLRRHGQELCRRSEPVCKACPLTKHCRYFREHQQRKVNP